MNIKDFYGEILNEHNINPNHKIEMSSPDITMRGVNPSCGDDITLNLKVKDGIISDGSFTGSGCAISQASVDMMLDLVIGKSKDDAIKLAESFMKMIKGGATEQEIEKLEEAGALQNISHMPARVKCAVLGWHTMEKMFENGEFSGQMQNPHSCSTEHM
jgi:nitrogen fixation NifU-like protein